MVKKPNLSQRASEEFEDAIVHAGSGEISCEFCNRVHFVSNREGFDWDEGEHERLLANSKKYPEKYIPHDEDSVGWGYLDGKQYVAGCPCNSAARYERFILKHRNVIIDYLKSRAEKNLRKARQESAQIESLSKIE